MSLRLATTLALALLALGGAARANEDGRQTNRSMRGCGTVDTCHRLNPGASARIEGPMNLRPGARGAYTLVLTSARGDFTAGGFNIAAEGATLAPVGALTQRRGSELTHLMPVPRSGAEVRVPFEVTAFEAEGHAMLFAAGNTVNRQRDSANDAWAVTMLALTIGDAATDAGSRADAGPRVERYDPTASSAYGGCAATPRRATRAWPALALLALGALARRSRCGAR